MYTLPALPQDMQVFWVQTGVLGSAFEEPHVILRIIHVWELQIQLNLLFCPLRDADIKSDLPVMTPDGTSILRALLSGWGLLSRF